MDCLCMLTITIRGLRQGAEDVCRNKGRSCESCPVEGVIRINLSLGVKPKLRLILFSLLDGLRWSWVYHKTFPICHHPLLSS